MLNVFVCEGEEILVLTNVNEISQDELTTMIIDSLTDDENNIVCDLAYEGVIVDDERMLNFKGTKKECTFEDYIKELKDFCASYYDGSED